MSSHIHFYGAATQDIFMTQDLKIQDGTPNHQAPNTMNGGFQKTIKSIRNQCGNPELNKS